MNTFARPTATWYCNHGKTSRTTSANPHAVVVIVATRGRPASSISRRFLLHSVLMYRMLATRPSTSWIWRPSGMGVSTKSACRCCGSRASSASTSTEATGLPATGGRGGGGVGCTSPPHKTCTETSLRTLKHGSPNSATVASKLH
eukprot:scaffold418_cov386-Prasinococcus_capsulatus_cf.AAC.6